MNRIKIAIVFDTKEDYGIDRDNLNFCDFSYLSDVEKMKEQLEYEGYEVILIHPPLNFLNVVNNSEHHKLFDVVFNMSEGFNSRNREILVPIICETLNIPYIGTDAFGLSFTNHKFQTKLFAKHLEINTPDYFYFDFKIHSYQYLIRFFQQNNSWFPLVVKPNREGTSMGLRKVHNISQLTKTVKELVKLYDQELIIEKYINGPDVLSFIIGTGNDTKVCPLVEVTSNNGEYLNLWDTEKKLLMNSKYINARLSEHTIEIIKMQSKLLHKALQLYDIARIDWRIDKDGIPFFLESTPLPSLGRDFDCCAKLMGLNFHQLIGIVLNLSLKRLKMI
jgi:D-alanine-D-alanine ligase